MKILTLSDLHSEWSSFTPRMRLADVLVLAGDIGRPMDVLEWASELCAGKHAIYVLGNHEFYRHDYDELLSAMRKRSKELGNVHVLERESVVLDGVRFLGTTLWTDYQLFGPEHKSTCMKMCEKALNDHRMITRNGRPFSVQDAAKEHSLSKAWLEHELDMDFDGPTIVVTHHGPHRKSLAPRFARDSVSAGFISSLPEEMFSRASAWVHGHTHVSFLYELNGCQIICNPRGYSYRADIHPENDDFNRNLLISVLDGKIEIVKDEKPTWMKEMEAKMSSLSKTPIFQHESFAMISRLAIPEEHHRSFDIFFENKEKLIVDGDTWVYFFDFPDWIASRGRELKREALKNPSRYGP